MSLKIKKSIVYYQWLKLYNIDGFSYVYLQIIVDQIYDCFSSSR